MYLNIVRKIILKHLTTIIGHLELVSLYRAYIMIKRPHMYEIEKLHTELYIIPY